MGNPGGHAGSDSRRFATTHWSLVITAGQQVTPQARQALAELCGIYWYPLYAFVRRQGYSADEAQDLTQGFFARLLEKNDLAAADQQRGRFRSWLLASLKHFLANEWDRSKAQKRGGGRQIISIDVESAESRYRMEPAHEMTPERIFERRWALTLLEQVLARLRRECAAEGKERLYEALKVFLIAGMADTPYLEIGGQLEMSEGAVKVAVHRLRRRYRELLQEEIAQTVDRPEQIDEEIRELFQALG